MYKGQTSCAEELDKLFRIVRQVVQKSWTSYVEELDKLSRRVGQVM